MPSLAAGDEDLDETLHSCKGHIDRLEVENFKSYAGKQQIGPFKQFTAIIGPNGSGKSNLMDAISFVLGVRTQHLRGSLQELLYSNSDMPAAARPTHGGVTLVYVPDDGQEIHFTRAIQPGGGSSSYQSVYRIDGRQVTLEAYTSRLGSFGILVKVRNFLVFQGDIEKVAAQTSEGLMQLLEQISGSDVLRQPYEEKEREKDAADKALAVLHNRKKAITAERKTKKEQKEEAERFLGKQQELQEQKLYYFLFRLYVAKHDEMALEDAGAKAADKLAAHEAQHTNYTADMEAIKKEQASVMRQRMKVEKEQHKQDKEKEKQASERIQLQEQLGRLRKKVKTDEKALEGARKAAAEADKGVRKLQQDLKKLQAAKAAAEGDAAGSAELQLNQAQLAEYHRLKDQAGTSTSKLAQDRATEQAQLQADEADLNRQMRQRQQLEERATKATDAAAAERSKAAQLQKEVAEAKSRLRELRKEQKEAENEMRRSTNMRGKWEKDLQEATNEYNSLRSSKAATEREKKMRDMAALLKKEVPGVHGRLSDLAKVSHKSYQLAMAVVLGYHMDAVVVDTKDTAYRCIDLLRARKADRMDFIPLDSAAVKPLPERLRSLGGTARPAIDLLDFDEGLERAMVHACGDALVCDTMEEACALSYERQVRVKVVSRDGTLFKPNGNFTGGHSTDEDGRSGRWDAARLEELKGKRDELREQIQALPNAAELQQASNALAAQVTGLSTEVTYKEADAKRAAEKAGEEERNASNLQASAEAQDPGLQKLQAEVAGRRKAVEKLTQRINAAMDRVFADFSRRVGVASVREWEETRLAELETQENKKAELETQINQVTSQLDYDQATAKKRAAEASTREGSLAKAQGELAALQAKTDALAEQHAGVDERAAELKQQADELLAQAEALSGRLAGLKKGEEAYQAGRNKLLGEVDKWRGRLERCKSDMAELLEAAAMEQVELPQAGGARSSKKRKHSKQQDTDADGDAEMGDAEDATQDGATPAADGDGGSWDFSLLEPRHKNLRDTAAQKKVEDELKQAVDSTVADLAALAPNLKAVEQYAEVREKERAQNAEVEAAKAAATSAAKAFTHVKERRHTRFMTAYYHIKDSIDAIYKALTRSQTHPMGGNAYLSLEDESDPFCGGLKYVAMPPTKRFRDMEQLSGGEKTVAALALLFAIHSFRPSPFFVLDEVDAALDAVNVARVAHYIRNKTRAGGSKGQEGGGGQDGKYEGFQTIVISLKDIFYEKADALVGVCRDLDRHCSTTLTLDLDRLPPPSEAL